MLMVSEMYGFVFISDLIRTIPESGLAKCMSAYLKCELCKFPPQPPPDGEEQQDLSDDISTSWDEILGDMMVNSFGSIRAKKK